MICIECELLQFLNTGNDIAARETCPCIWIINPRETGKVLQHVMSHGKVVPLSSVFTGDTLSGKQECLPDDPSLIAAGIVPGTDASLTMQEDSHGVHGHGHHSSSSLASAGGGGSVGGGLRQHSPPSRPPTRARSISGELGKLCVYTGDVV